MPNEKVKISTITRYNGKKITQIENLPEEIDQERLLKTFKRQFNCNGTIDNRSGTRLLLVAGDQRQNFMLYLKNILNIDDIEIL